jgi:hypothetical protein
VKLRLFVNWLILGGRKWIVNNRYPSRAFNHASLILIIHHLLCLLPPLLRIFPRFRSTIKIFPIIINHPLNINNRQKWNPPPQSLSGKHFWRGGTEKGIAWPNDIVVVEFLSILKLMNKTLALSEKRRELKFFYWIFIELNKREITIGFIVVFCWFWKWGFFFFVDFLIFYYFYPSFPRNVYRSLIKKKTQRAGIWLETK